MNDDQGVSEVYKVAMAFLGGISLGIVIAFAAMDYFF